MAFSLAVTRYVSILRNIEVFKLHIKRRWAVYRSNLPSGTPAGMKMIGVQCTALVVISDDNSTVS